MWVCCPSCEDVCFFLPFFGDIYTCVGNFLIKPVRPLPWGPEELIRFGSCDCCLRDPPKKLVSLCWQQHISMDIYGYLILINLVWKEIDHLSHVCVEAVMMIQKLGCGSCARVPWSWSTLWKSEYCGSNYSNKHRVTPQERCCSSRGVSGCPLVVFLVIFENHADPVSTVVLFVCVRSLVPLKAFCFGFQTFLFSPWSHLAREEPLPTIGILPQCKSGFPNPFQKKVSKIFLKKGVD